MNENVTAANFPLHGDWTGGDEPVEADTDNDGDLWNDWDKDQDPFATQVDQEQRRLQGGNEDPTAFLSDFTEVLGETDAPIFQQLFDGMSDITPETGKELVQRYVDLSKSEQRLQDKADASDLNTALAQLRRYWGPKFESNLNEMKADLRVLPFFNDMLDARMPDGTLLFNHSEFIRFLHRLMRK